MKLSDKAEKRIEDVKALYPSKQSAAMVALYIVQEELGCLDERAVAWVSEKAGLAPVHVQELISFYSMYRQKPLGKYHFQVCRTLSCAVRGSKKLSEALAHKFGTRPREVTPDGMFSFEEVECLGSCGTAPMCQVNDCFFEKLTAAELLKIVDQIQKDKPNLSLSMIEDKLGEGLKGYSKSQVLG